jgi:TolB protein
VSIAPFRGEDAFTAKIAAIISSDLERSGQFKLIPSGMVGADESIRPEFSALRQRGTDALAAGSVTRLADGRVDVRFKLWDVVRASELVGQSYVVPPADMRLVSHRIADQIYEKLTGDKGVFSTRIAYVTRGSGRYNLWVADADGEGAQSALTSAEPIISPSWAPNGRQLAYVSFEQRKAVVYIHDVQTGARRELANFRGTNSAPRWAPDGRSVALSLSREGGTQLYLIPSGGGQARRLTQSGAIDTEPCFSADGSQIYFVSDRGGSPQIYRMSAGGGEAQRVTFSGSYNISPNVSADGRYMAYVSRVGGAFRLHVMDLQSGSVSAISDSSGDERPSFAPNSRWIVYATQQGGREALMTTTVDGKVKARLAGAAGDIREPDWGPLAR